MPIKTDIKIVSFTAASGSGKTAIGRYLLDVDMTGRFRMLPSYTTRNWREGDIKGEYSYFSEKVFQKFEERGDFIWTAAEHGNYYGTTYASLDEALELDMISFMSVVPKVMPDLIKYAGKAVMPVYISKPSDDTLRERLGYKRGAAPDDIERRIKDCKEWEKEARASDIDYTFIFNEGIIEDPVIDVLLALVNTIYTHPT